MVYKEKNYLTEKFLNYQKGSYPLKKLKDDICLFIYQSFKNYFNSENFHDFSSDAMVYFIEKLENIIKNFKYREIRFEFYLYQYFKFLIMRKIKENNQKEIRSYYAGFLCEDKGFYIEEEKFEYADSDDIIKEKIFKIAKADKNTIFDYKKRFLILIFLLKVSFHIDENQLDYICELLNFDKPTIYNYIFKIREVVVQKKVYLDMLQSRKNKIMVKLQTGEHDNLKLQNNLSKLNRKMEKISISPSSVFLSDLLNMEKYKINRYLSFCKNLNLLKDIGEKIKKIKR